MNNYLEHMDQILAQQISGYHRYALDAPFHLIYASQNLSDMTGICTEQLEDEKSDQFACLVYAEDRKNYHEFLCQLSQKAQTLKTQYRLVRRDGSILHVQDTAVSRIMEDGRCIADSVLTDITDIRTAHDDLLFLQNEIPCGFMRFTCEKQPKITYINAKMIEMLRLPAGDDGELDYLEMTKSNIFLMIPMEERRRLGLYLNRVYSSDMPIAGETELLRCDGTRAHVFGWVARHINEQGIEEFQSVCMDITDSHAARIAAGSARYRKALMDVYDKIFQFNLAANTVICLHCEEKSTFNRFRDMAVNSFDALDKWLLEYIVTEDRARVRTFFMDFLLKKEVQTNPRPAQVTYQAYANDGSVRKYNGIFIRFDEMSSFYCCRCLGEEEKNAALLEENNQLKETMKEWMSHFSDGGAAFEVTSDGLVKPLYASENVQEFFGYTSEEWLALAEKYTPLENFVAYSEAPYEAYVNLLKEGEAEFNYFDYRAEKEKRIKAICSHREGGRSATRYVMLYKMGDGAVTASRSLTEHRKVMIRTFGYFDVFIGDRPVAFRNKKSKELFALLTDRRGGYVTSEEAIGFLWEDEPVSTVTLSRYRKVALRLKNTLEEYGIADVIETTSGKRRIVTEKVDCDLYQYLTGQEAYAQLFKGSYLNNYSWGEVTLGELLNMDN